MIAGRPERARFCRAFVPLPALPGHARRTVVTATMTASSPMTAAVTGRAALPPMASAVLPAAAPSAVAI